MSSFPDSYTVLTWEILSNSSPHSRGISPFWSWLPIMVNVLPEPKNEVETALIANWYNYSASAKMLVVTGFRQNQNLISLYIRIIFSDESLDSKQCTWIKFCSFQKNLERMVWLLKDVTLIFFLTYLKRNKTEYSIFHIYKYINIVVDRTCLSVGKNAGIVTFKSVFQDIWPKVFVYFLLTWIKHTLNNSQ